LRPRPPARRGRLSFDRSRWIGGARKNAPVAEERVDKILLQLDLQELADVKAATLPYGHQKLVGLAIAFAADPKLIMLDEPAAGLNGQEARHLVGVYGISISAA
jgi:ABC-type branched-subunit amino acid transport system ATPase component